jgi:hypothetical protein
VLWGAPLGLAATDAAPSEGAVCSGAGTAACTPNGAVAGPDGVEVTLIGAVRDAIGGAAPDGIDEEVSCASCGGVFGCTPLVCTARTTSHPPKLSTLHLHARALIRLKTISYRCQDAVSGGADP